MLTLCNRGGGGREELKGEERIFLCYAINYVSGNSVAKYQTNNDDYKRCKFIVRKLQASSMRQSEYVIIRDAEP